MKKEISLFVMDVSDYARDEIGNELNDYFEDLKISIGSWTQYITPTKVMYRSNRELIVISNGYASAYLLAFYLTRIWKYKNHLPYFSLSFGIIEEDLSTINIDTWNHPLLQEAKRAVEVLKNKQSRKKFQFIFADLLDREKFYMVKSEFEKMLNTISDLMQEHLNNQTDIQSLVCSLYVILGQQNKVSEYLNRTKSTISSHMKNGKTIVILNAFNNLVSVLDSLQTEPPFQKTEELQMNIKQNILQHLQIHFPKK